MLCCQQPLPDAQISMHRVLEIRARHRTVGRLDQSTSRARALSARLRRHRQTATREPDHEDGREHVLALDPELRSGRLRPGGEDRIR